MIFPHFHRNDFQVRNKGKKHGDSSANPRALRFSGADLPDFLGRHIHHGLFETGKESPAKAQLRMLEHCAGLLGIAGGERVLDAGCGHGGTLLFLATRHDCQGTGLTLSPKQAKIAAQNATKASVGDRIEFVVQDVRTYQFPSEAFGSAGICGGNRNYS
jgi:SAM-dependent methyltransferase